MRTPTATSGPVIPGPDEQVASIALAPLDAADRAVDEAIANRDRLYAAARDAGWTFSAMEGQTRHKRGWIHTLVKRGREASEDAQHGHDNRTVSSHKC